MHAADDHAGSLVHGLPRNDFCPVYVGSHRRNAHQIAFAQGVQRKIAQIFIPDFYGNFVWD